MVHDLQICRGSRSIQSQMEKPLSAVGELLGNQMMNGFVEIVLVVVAALVTATLVIVMAIAAAAAATAVTVRIAAVATAATTYGYVLWITLFRCFYHCS